jgi:gas vesicle protein
MTDHSKGYLWLLGGVLIGSLVGAGAAILTAPQSGSKTRALLVEKGVELKDKVASGTERSRDRAVQAFSGVKEQAAGIVRRIRSSSAAQPVESLELPVENSSTLVEA